jgi:hypothetical protein
VAVSGWFLASQVIGYATQYKQNKVNYQAQIDTYFDRVSTANSNIAIINAEYTFNSSLISEQERRLGLSHQIALYDNLGETTSQVAAVKVQNEDRFGPSAEAWERNVQRQGLKQRTRLNTVNELALWDLDAKRYILALKVLNQRHNIIKSIGRAPSAEGYVLNQIGTGLSAFNKIGFREDKNGNIVSRFSFTEPTGLQSPSMGGTGLSVASAQPKKYLGTPTDPRMAGGRIGKYS